MPDRIIVRGARQIVTARGLDGPRRGRQMRELSILTDGAMLVEKGIITHVGPAARVENLAGARGAFELDVEGCVVLPAFVDSHTHLVFGPPRLQDYEMRIQGRSYEQITAAGGGILNSVRSVRTSPARRLMSAAHTHLGRFARQGTATLEAKSGYGLDENSEFKTLRIAQAFHRRPLEIVSTFLGAHAVPPEFEGRAGDFIRHVCTDVLPHVARRGLARFADVYCDRNAFSVDLARLYLQTAVANGLGLKVHASQFESIGAVALAVELGAISVDHLEAATATEVDLLTRSATIATLLPGSVFHLGRDRYPPARSLIDGGAAVALATDFNPGSSPTSSMPMILSLACLHMKMTPAEAICAATHNGAYALGLGAVTGSLESGKRADFIVAGVGDYREIPYYFGVNLVTMLVKSGEIIYQEKEFPWPAD